MTEGYLPLFTNILYFEISVPVNNDYSTSWRLWSRQWFVVPLVHYRNFPRGKHLLITLANVPYIKYTLPT